ncbi:hypothetical protein BRYFOR_08444 [Marvinbryantia formatexigens DSM 14469]|uniref:Uncharacterized protein n=1 Tax=Marvinbryantia formatexigens DSM 14469 TaxID=478749 RepID=C6LIK6_9FIRM|nr:hypothetical protein BRYFOR_08444 [Marvinbryantia formatexigens DSM 14469]
MEDEAKKGGVAGRLCRLCCHVSEESCRQQLLQVRYIHRHMVDNVVNCRN